MQAEDLMRPVEDSAGWDALPPALHAAIESRTGAIKGTSPAGEGLSTSVRLILHSESGDVFVKGTGPDSTDHQRKRLALGAALAPYVTAISPPLLFEAEADGWNVTGWPVLPGRPWADQKPDSPDIPKMAGLLRTLAEIPAPHVLTRTARDEWEPYTDDPGVFDGDRLCHRDPNPTNFVVDGDRAWMVDWGWATRGPAWMTAGLLGLSMMEAGWEPGEAEQALADVPAWRDAPPDAVNTLASANARMWDAAVEQAPTKVRKFRRDIARKWAAHREQTGALLPHCAPPCRAPLGTRPAVGGRDD
jgi:hypothetical protein